MELNCKKWNPNWQKSSRRARSVTRPTRKDTTSAKFTTWSHPSKATTTNSTETSIAILHTGNAPNITAKSHLWTSQCSKSEAVAQSSAPQPRFPLRDGPNPNPQSHSATGRRTQTPDGQCPGGPPRIIFSNWNVRNLLSDSDKSF